MKEAMTLTARCACGRVLIKLMGAPIVSVVCYCDDCQEGARRIESMPNTLPVKYADGGTPYVAYRKDRIEYAAGREYLVPHKLRPESTTYRAVASCCLSAMYLGFDDSKHWVDVYRLRVQGAVPPLQMRICTRFALRPEAIPEDVSRHRGYPFGLIARLIGARIAMMLRL